MTGSVIFAGGGTGGHLFPGLAIAEELRTTAPELAYRFVCSQREIDARILEQASVLFTPIAAHPFTLRPRALFRFASTWGGVVRTARGILTSHAVRAVVATGGFVAAPVVEAARRESIPTVLVNLDAVPGKANRWIARHAQVALSSADGPAVPTGWERIAPIVRSSARASGTVDAARAHFDLDPDRQTLLVTGGSQGARSINALMLAYTSAHGPSLRGWQVIHQCGDDTDPAALREAYTGAGVPCFVEPFIENMGVAWRASDLCVGRAGAGTVAEVWASHVPAILLPYPYHRDEHQRHNAERLEHCGGGIILRDQVDPEKNVAAVGPELSRLLEVAAQRDRMKAALASLGPADGAAAAAHRLLEVLRDT
jgi:UDP-N-acetylglucosamine--N-acetylmuramyl-(pentapeptide) pyrophosphoryl-undecaprenol N-acetylglucosamine transferase